MSPRLPHHRRWNWRILARNNFRTIALAFIALALSALLLVGSEYFREYHARLDAESAHLSLIADVHRLAAFGAPGHVVTDWAEGTASEDE